MEERLAVRMDYDLCMARLMALNIKRHESLLTVRKAPLSSRDRSILLQEFFSIPAAIEGKTNC